MAQSIGGGGGSGGAALSGSIGAGFDVSVAVGGSGGSGQDGGSVIVSLADTMISTGQNSILIEWVGRHHSGSMHPIAVPGAGQFVPL